MDDDTYVARVGPPVPDGDEHDELVSVVESLVRSGQVVDAARLATTAHPDARTYRAALDRLRADGFGEHADALELAVRVPAVLAYDDEATARATWLSAAWLALVGVLTGVATWPTSARVVGAVLVSAALLAAVSRFPQRWTRLVALASSAVLVVGAVVLVTDASVVDVTVGLLFYGAVLVAITWKGAYLVAVRGWEREQLMGLRTTGLTEREVSLARGLYDHMLYGSAAASSMAVARAAAAVVVSWLLAAGLVGLAIGRGASGALVGLAVSFFVTLASLVTLMQVDMVRMRRNPHFGRDAVSAAPAVLDVRSGLSPSTLPIAVPRPRQGGLRALLAGLLVAVAALVPLGWTSLVVGLVAASLGGLLWWRYTGTYVNIDDDGVTDRWLLGTRRLAWSVIVEITIAGRHDDPGLRLLTKNGDARHLIDASRVGLLTASQIVDAARIHARAAVPSNVGTRRRLRLLGTGALACVALALFALLFGGVFGEMRAPVDPATVPPDRQIWVDARGELFVQCPSPAAVLTGASTELCTGQLRGQLIATAVVVVVLAAVIWAVMRVRPGRLE